MGMVILIAVIAIVALGVQAYLSSIRRKELATVAARLGLSFSPGTNRDLPGSYRFLNKLDCGSNRYAQNVISGVFRGAPVLVFDYHYQVQSGKNTHHYSFSFFILTLPRAFPELTIVREGVLSKLAQAVGYEDIDFESYEFSRRFCVRSKDKRFAYDFCNAQMMEYLLANDDLAIEIENDALALAFGSCLSGAEIERNLNRLAEVRAGMPSYLFEGA